MCVILCGPWHVPVIRPFHSFQPSCTDHYIWIIFFDPSSVSWYLREKWSLYNQVKAHVQEWQYDWMRIIPLSPSFRNVFTCQLHKCLWKTFASLHKNPMINQLRKSRNSECVKVFTLPSSTLCLDSSPPPFFTATSSVLLCSSTIDTLNSKLTKATQQETVTHYCYWLVWYLNLHLNMHIQLASIHFQ